MNRNPFSKHRADSENEYLKLTGIAFELLAILLSFVGGGYFLDEYLSLGTPWFTIAGTMLATIGILVHLFRKLR